MEVVEETEKDLDNIEPENLGASFMSLLLNMNPATIEVNNSIYRSTI